MTAKVNTSSAPFTSQFPCLELRLSGKTAELGLI